MIYKHLIVYGVYGNSVPRFWRELEMAYKSFIPNLASITKLLELDQSLLFLM